MNKVEPVEGANVHLQQEGGTAVMQILGELSCGVL